MKKHGNCKYCGCVLGEYQTICGNCKQKLKLILKMQKMIRDTAERGKRNV